MVTVGDSAPLPSAESAAALVRGEDGSITHVLRDVALRGVLVGVGMAIFGERKHLIRNALAGSLAIEGFVLIYQLAKR
jgi:hypothetical protein